MMLFKEQLAPPSSADYGFEPFSEVHAKSLV
jgi:hypothetical protein